MHAVTSKLTGNIAYHTQHQPIWPKLWKRQQYNMPCIFSLTCHAFSVSFTMSKFLYETIKSNKVRNTMSSKKCNQYSSLLSPLSQEPNSAYSDGRRQFYIGTAADGDDENDEAKRLGLTIRKDVFYNKEHLPAAAGLFVTADTNGRYINGWVTKYKSKVGWLGSHHDKFKYGQDFRRIDHGVRQQLHTDWENVRGNRFFFLLALDKDQTIIV